MNALSEEQKEAAFRHEAAHRVSRDNLKKFLFLLAPDILPMVSGLSNLERGWARFTEWAADDQAVDGDPQRALSLAAALVKVAKMGVHPTPSYLLSSLVDDDLRSGDESGSSTAGAGVCGKAPRSTQGICS